LLPAQNANNNISSPKGKPKMRLKKPHPTKKSRLLKQNTSPKTDSIAQSARISNASNAGSRII
jgi:hypothetical protein